MRASTCAFCLGLGAFISGGATATSAHAAEPPAEDDSGPDIELLEYLGDLVDDHDRWVGPEDMKGMADAEDSTIVLDGDATGDAKRVK